MAHPCGVKTNKAPGKVRRFNTPSPIIEKWMNECKEIDQKNVTNEANKKGIQTRQSHANFCHIQSYLCTCTVYTALLHILLYIQYIDTVDTVYYCMNIYIYVSIYVSIYVYM